MTAGAQLTAPAGATATIDIARRRLPELVALIDEPARGACARMLDDLAGRFAVAQGSSRNHQAWTGGYYDHVCEVLNLAFVDYQLKDALRPLDFSLSDALLVLFLHDLEKAFRYDAHGNADPALDDKTAKAALRHELIDRYAITLTVEQANALRYVEGEHDDYSNRFRAMGRLAAFCHVQDCWSARGWHDHPLADGDPWAGAQRVSGPGRAAAAHAA